MASLKDIRKRIGSVKSTQKITRAMKMVAGARLNRAQQRIVSMRPYAVKTRDVLAEVTSEARKEMLARQQEQGEGEEESVEAADEAAKHPLLAVTRERHVLLVVLTSDRGLCGSFNASICKMADRQWKQREAEGQKVSMFVLGRKGRDYFKRRNAPMHYIDGAWDNLDWDGARELGRKILHPFMREKDSVDSIYLIYNEFKSAISQQVVCEALLPVPEPTAQEASEHEEHKVEFLFEPSEEALLHQLVPMYVQVSVLRSLYESMASELGARMTAMDAATNNASDMISKLTLQYNRARQAAITKELMEIIGGAEALKG